MDNKSPYGSQLHAEDLHAPITPVELLSSQPNEDDELVDGLVESREDELIIDNPAPKQPMIPQQPINDNVNVEVLTEKRGDPDRPRRLKALGY